MSRLDGKVCLITGAGSGIGQASARLFAREGATVVVADVDLDAARSTVVEMGDPAWAEHVDVTDEAQTVALAARVIERFKRIDVLFNNAGIAGVGDILETEPDLFDRVMRVNVRGVYLMARAVVPYMIERRSGSIINMSSCIAEIGLARRVSYAASKGAVLALTKSMQVDLAPHGIRVNALLPGTILTRWYKGQSLKVQVLRYGFEYDGQVYKSLSAVAKAITGSHTSGHLFFRRALAGRGR